MKSDHLYSLYGTWKRWCATADHSEDGWQSDFPQWQELMEAAIETMTQHELPAAAVSILEECWSASQEDEELLTFSSEHLDDCWPALQALAQSRLSGCRWQVYEAAAGIGRPAEGMLRRGLSDQDGYARRRALLSLARVRPADAETLAEHFIKDMDPYMRQAAIGLVLVSADSTFRRQALSLLKADLVEHVRKAADAAWREETASTGGGPVAGKSPAEQEDPSQEEPGTGDPTQDKPQK